MMRTLLKLFLKQQQFCAKSLVEHFFVPVSLAMNLSTVSPSSWAMFLNTCLSYGSLILVAKYASRALSSPSAGPGSINVSKSSCTSIPAVCRSRAFFWTSFLTPLASMKYQSTFSHFFHRGANAVELPLQSNGGIPQRSTSTSAILVQFSTILVASIMFCISNKKRTRRQAHGNTWKHNWLFIRHAYKRPLTTKVKYTQT